jgi:hypothetical protein
MRRTGRRIGLLVMAFLLATGPGSLHNEAQAVDSASQAPKPGRFDEVGQIPLPPSSFAGQGFPDTSGWLILDSENRRGYTLTELSLTRTVIESFDLDTLAPLRRVTVPGLPVPGGQVSGEGGEYFSGDVVHAVDARAKRVYLAMSASAQLGLNNDTHRALSHVLVLDEAQFDTDPEHAFGAFLLPATEQRLGVYPLMGMVPSRHHVSGDASFAKLLALFASPAPDLSPSGVPGVKDHTLVQWDVSSVRTGQAAPAFPQKLPGSYYQLPPAATPLPPADWEQVLTACATAPITSTESAANAVGVKNYKWDVLPTRDAIYVPCNSAPNSGAVARVALDPSTGSPAPPPNQQVTALGKPIGNAVADLEGGRLYLSSFGGGMTWWVFDAATNRFAGAMAGTLAESTPLAAGIDQATGRFYAYTPDYCATRTGGGSLPVRGGIRIADARLDPVPAAENVRPDIPYPTRWRIAVDSVTRRVFVRRGGLLDTLQYRYPSCVQNDREPAPVERFWRVFEDRTPVAVAPTGFDDAQLTTNVPESRDLTQASYLGSGSGFGARMVLTGGLDALTQNAVTSAKSSCGRDDRELLVGSVGNVDLSDQSVSAGAASLDADANTQVAFGNPVSRCRPQVPPGMPQAGELNKCQGDTDELAFDEPEKDGRDLNKDGCVDRTGVNKYEARCFEDGPPALASGPPGRTVSRDGFVARVSCDGTNEKAEGAAEGALGSKQVDQRQSGLPAPVGTDDPLRIGRSVSEVAVTRVPGKGVTVKVQSITRDVEVPGIGTIGAVRAEATSTANGRDRGARSSFKRTICDVHLGDVVVSGCLGDEDQQSFIVRRFNDTFAGRAAMRLRQPDRPLFEGTSHGYLTAVQRDQNELFGDQTITRDHSLAVPALEIILFQGDGGAWGAGRQVLQLAGVQASTSYGIVCVYGQAANGQCSDGRDELVSDDLTDGIAPLATLDGPDEGDLGVTSPKSVESPPQHEPTIVRVVRNIPRALAQALQLLFNNPRELGLMAAVWALLYAPCYLGERRRSVSGLRARRAAAGGVG